ncbi:YncE family protein [Sulfidibacter corallicola]|uniref:YncE family protein n=1 Tax=Sulfidibacter corallicola TaxID=2818388 RepID=A0A8A4TNS3_SULCO|nr:YncE family protein [Sulfidibacter corallicola]QTD50854.1 YncE family protein [Sulfidibacter corallicola]
MIAPLVPVGGALAAEDPVSPSAGSGDRAAATTEAPAADTIRVGGIQVAFEATHVDRAKPAGTYVEGDDLVVSFRITDTASGIPLERLYPAAWMDPRVGKRGTNDRLCADKARTFLSGSLLSKAEIDLNVFYVVALNRDATITVVDPLFGFGGSKLLAMVRLAGPGEDWVLTPDQRLLFVSTPEVNEVAVVNTTSWRVVAAVPVASYPQRLYLQQDGSFLWVAHRGGVSAVSCETFEVVARVDTGPGPHDLVGDRDNRYLFVANSGADSVSVVDMRQRRKTTDLPVGRQPISLSYSATAESVLVACRKDGVIAAIDVASRTLRARMPTAPGLRQVAFAPDGRLAFAVNPERNELHIVDAARNRIVQSGTMAERPSQVAFTHQLAYVLHEGDDTVYMIPLTEVGVPGKPIPLIDFPGTHYPVPAKHETLVTALVPSPVDKAVIFANPADSAIYYYREGMAAPSGQFNNYGHVPRAVRVLDRSLQERGPIGLYQTTAHLRKAGTYDVVFFLENPRVIHCFQLEVSPDPRLVAQRRHREVHLQYLTRPGQVPVQRPTPLDFRIVGADDRARTGLKDLEVRLVAPGGIWHKRLEVKEIGGVGYRVVIEPPRPGYYYVYVASDSAGLKTTNTNYLVVKAAKPAERAAADEASTAERPGGGH